MFEVGWSELLVIAVVMIVVVGPKDLPSMLRTFGRTAAKLRTMAADFQKQFNDALKEAELDDVKSSVDSLRGLNPMTEIRKQLNPFEQAAADVRAGVDTMMKPKPADPAASEPQAAEPLKNGATEMPGVNGTEAAPAAPVFPAMADASGTAPVTETALPAAQPAKKAATSKTRTAGAAAKTAASKAPAEKASTKSSSPAAAKAAAPARKVASKSEAKAAAPKKPAAKKTTDTKKTAGAAK
ncbi:twin-arginine translocase subunit TatB [Mesorhizobium tamadayense]|uniref:Sec-independent protein translocase protein TatB n=1 Tax=Mesorhizobium tamadayense TaxID=425306 RepID=A0A3P3FUQ6_9HYPH|nr:Sec-independent protein translocase protein TatB [Mesorhizobium tamadayense]RRI02355.1 twin-arginine translocase subunit TatB [Mesorhizobium tamadayense]